MLLLTKLFVLDPVASTIKMHDARGGSGKTRVPTNLPQRFYRLAVCDRLSWPAHEPMHVHSAQAPIRLPCAM